MKVIKFTLMFMLAFFVRYNLSAQITGTRIIDNLGGGNYMTFAEALSDVQSQGISGNVTFLVKSGSYNEQILIDDFNYPDTIFFKKFDPYGSVTVNYNPTGTNYVLGFYNSSKIIISGMAFQNSNDDISTEGTVVDFWGNCTNITLDSCQFNGINTTYEYESKSVIHHNDPDGNNVCSNINILNSQITAGSKGIFFKGSTNGESNNTFAGNYISEYYSVGVEALYQNYVSIGKNNIYSNSGSYTQKAISVTGANNGEAFIYDNKISAYASVSNTGIEAFANSDSVFITNNMVMISYGESSPNVCISADNNMHLRIYHNSTTISNTLVGTNILLGGGNTDDILVLNNIFFNNAGFQMTKAGTASAYLIYLDETLLPNSINHNIYFSETPVTFGFDGINDIIDFNEWQATTSQDNFSNFVNPQFYAIASDLHIFQPSWAESNAIHTLPYTQFDIDGQFRHGIPGYEGQGTAPDIGADEGDFEGYVSGISGQIANGTTWSGTIEVTGNIMLDSVSTLTILPGTKVRFSYGSNFMVHGRIIAGGTPDQKIIFFGGVGDGWKGITHFNSYGMNASVYKFCEFEGSTKYSDNGGALQIFTDSVFVEKCVFSNNNAINGGAVIIANSSPVITNSHFKYNYAQGSGGAIYIESSANPSIVNNIFEGNSAYNYGGAIYITYTLSDKIWNNTIIGNYASIGGLQIALNNATASLYNNIIWNSSQNNSAIYITDAATILNLYNCNLPDSANTVNIENPGAGTVYPMSTLEENPIFNGIYGFMYQLDASSPCIDAGYSPSPFAPEMVDFAGFPRLSCNKLDIGAFEFNGCRLFADAGADQVLCSTSATITANDPAPNIGYWTSYNPQTKFGNINSPTTTVTNLQPGVNEIFWTVTDQVNSVSDFVMITNMQPIVYAGEDIFAFSEIYGAPFGTYQAYANQAIPMQIGYWEQISGASVLLSNSASETADIDVQYGISSFKWTIEDDGCVNSDTLFVSAGYSFISNPSDGTLDWSNPADWDVNFIPGPSDSVTIYNCIATISGPNAMCRNLFIGSNVNLFLGGTAKGNAVLTAQNLVVEENAVKFKGIKGSSILEIGDYGTLNIASTDPLNPLGESTLKIGSNGTIFVHSSAVKGEKAYGEGGVNIGSGGRLFISQTAEKASVAGEALMEIGSGGRLFISQTAEKGIKPLSNANVNIGSGGRLFIHQTAEKGAAGGKVELGSGGRIFISQTAEKGAAGGKVELGSGGRIFISQTAEKGAATSGAGVTIGSGGRLFISQTAEKGLDTAKVSVTQIDIEGGSLYVGDNTGGNNLSVLECESLNIYPNTVTAQSDTNLYVFANGLVSILKNDATPEFSKIYISDDADFTIEQNGKLDLSQTGNAAYSFVLYPKSSFTDRNTNSAINARAIYELSSSGVNIFGTYFSDATTEGFSNLYEMSKWDESTLDWTDVYAGQNFETAVGYMIDGVSTDAEIILEGELNTGDKSQNITAEYTDETFAGWNFAANPYPSYIIWDSVEFNAGVSPVYYAYNKETDNFGIYQKGGLYLNNASSKIAPQEPFFMRTTANAVFTVPNSARTNNFEGYISNVKSVPFQNVLKLKTSGTTYTDETIMRFTSLATENYDYQYDALLIPNMNTNSPSLYTVYGNQSLEYDINALPLNETETIIPLYFKSGYSESYTISIAESSLNDNVGLFIRDLAGTGEWIDLKISPTYSFNYVTGDNPARFELKFSGEMINVEETENAEPVKVYSNSKNIYIEYYGNENLSVQIFDINGKMLNFKTFNTNGQNVINTNLPSGIYFVKTISETQNSAHKIIIK